MAQTVSIIIVSEARARLAAVIEDRNSPQKHVQRMRIVLLSADRLPVLEVARQRHQPPGGVALAIALCRARGGWPLAGQDAQARQSPCPVGDRAQGAGAAVLRAAPQCHALDQPRGRQGRRRQLADGSTHLGRASPSTSSPAYIQEIQRSRLRREGGGRRRLVHGAALPRRGAVHR
jgi:hypothetical protein